jgi:hypothetical protein
MVSVLVIHEKQTKTMLEYVAIARDAFPSLERYISVKRQEAEALSKKYGLAQNVDLELFEGGARTVDGFFRMFPQFKRFAWTIERHVQGTA